MPEVMTTYPDEDWLTRLNADNLVFLSKERVFASVEWPFLENEPSTHHRFGRIGLRRSEDGRGVSQTWLVRANGRGNDNSQCIMPVVGHLPRDQPIRNIQSRLESLQRQNELAGQILRSLTSSIRGLENRFQELERRAFPLMAVGVVGEGRMTEASLADAGPGIQIPDPIQELLLNGPAYNDAYNVEYIGPSIPIQSDPFRLEPISVRRVVGTTPRTADTPKGPVSPETPTAWDRIGEEDTDEG